MNSAPALAQAPDSPLLRMQYFEEQRAFPGATIPAGALNRARQQMRDRWPDVLLPRPTEGPAAFALSASAWTAIGPAPIANGSAGRISTVAVDPTNSNVLYIGGAQGGVWKSADAGATWTVLTDNECSLAMGSIAIDPVDTRIVYAGTGELHFSGDSYYGCGVLRSTDGGLSWTRLGESVFGSSTGGARISRLIVDAASAGSTSGTTLFAASSTGLWVSRDSGLSWTRTLAGVISDLQVDAAGPQVLYAAIGTPASAAANGVYKSIDAGTTWTRLTSFPTTNVGRIALGASPAVPGTVYAAVQDGFDNGSSDGRFLGIWRTTDGGTTWVARNGTQANCNTQCWYDLVIAVDPTNPDEVWFGGVPLFRSLDGGNNFVNVLRNAHVDQHAITFDPSDPGTLYIGNDGGVYRSRDDATTWQSLNDGLSITQFYAGVSVHPTDTTIVLGGTQDNGTLEARGSDIWFSVLGADGGFTAIDFLDPSYSWAETQWTTGSGFAGPRLRTGTGSFERMVNGIDTNDRALFIPPLVMDRTASATLYFGTFRLYRTTSRGALWGTISPDLTKGSTTNGRISAIAPSESDPATVWVGTSDGNVQVTRNSGVTWDLRTTGLPSRYVTDIAVDGVDPDVAVLTVSGFGTGHVFRTVNGGQSWTDISGVLPDVPVNAVLTDRALGGSLYIGTDLGVFRSFDNGASWEPFGAGLPNVAVFDLVFNRSTGIAVAGTHGRSAFAFRPATASLLAIGADSVRLSSIGDTTRLSAVALDLAGDTINGLTPVWRSEDPSVVTIDGDGLVTAVANGAADVIALFAGAADTARVVVEQVAADIANLPSALDLVQGEVHIVAARPVDALGEIIADATILWATSNSSVAIVDPDGTVRALGTGSATITATVDQLQEFTAVTVAPPSTASVSAAPAVVPDRPFSAAGTIVPLLTLDVDVDGLEPVRITQLTFLVSGDDPQANLSVVRDVNGNGQADPAEPTVTGITLNLSRDAPPTEATLRPADMIINGGVASSFVVVLRLSGASPNGAVFETTWTPELTAGVGTRSGVQNRLVLPSAPVTSASVTSTVLGGNEVLTFSENPVRSDRVIFNFREAPAVAAVYTVTGLLVIDLTRDIEGDNRIEWDLRNGDGNRVAAGVYLVIFDIGGTVMRERLLVLPPRDPADRETATDRAAQTRRGNGPPP